MSHPPRPLWEINVLSKSSYTRKFSMQLYVHPFQQSHGELSDGYVKCDIYALLQIVRHADETRFCYYFFSQFCRRRVVNYRQLQTVHDFVIVFNLCYVCGVYGKVTDPLFYVEPREWTLYFLQSNLPSSCEVNFIWQFCNV